MTRAAGHRRIRRLVIQLALILGLSVPVPAGADGLSLLSLSARARISNSTTLGQQQPEEFDEYTLAAHFGLPWQSKPSWGWVVDTRLMASAGLMQGAGETGLVASLIPEIGLRHEDWPFLVDLGVGGALLSRYEVGTQDFGGPFQFALTTGANVKLTKRFGIGYRFMHYSDAGLNGDHTVGADFHMVELFYHF
jgi:hypothetical protein